MTGFLAILISLGAVSLPLLVLFGGARLMGRASQRHLVLRALAGSGADERDKAFLNQRWRGYSKADAHRHWSAIASDRDGAALAAEKHFLKLDLILPVAYCAAMWGGLALLWHLLDRPFAYGWLVLPVVATLFADWVENSIQLGQLAHFEPHDESSLDSRKIRFASAATSLKLLAFALTEVFIFVLGVLLSFCSPGA